MPLIRTLHVRNNEGSCLMQYRSFSVGEFWTVARKTRCRRHFVVVSAPCSAPCSWVLFLLFAPSLTSSIYNHTCTPFHCPQVAGVTCFYKQTAIVNRISTLHQPITPQTVTGRPLFRPFHLQTFLSSLNSYLESCLGLECFLDDRLARCVRYASISS